MSTIDHIKASYHSEVPSAEGLRVAIAVAEWNSNITEPLYLGAVEVLRRQGAAEICTMRVPGTFELINASVRLKAEGYDAVIAIGCVVRGDTPHFDYICQGVTQGIAHLNATQEIPVIYGLLTTNDLQQAKDRCGGRLGNKGDECAIDAIKMAKF